MRLNDELDRKVDLTELLENLEFTEEDVARAALMQPKLYYNAGRLRMQKLHEKNSAEVRLDLIKYSLTLKIRERDSAIPKEKGVRVEKKTEGHLKEIVSRNVKYRECLADFNKAAEEESFARMMLEAYEMRMQAIKVIANVAGMEHAVEKQLRAKADELNAANRNIRRKYAT